MTEVFNNKMNKRGVIVELAGLVIIVGLVIIGAVNTKEILSNQRYVGDSSTNTSYDLRKCFVEIKKENLVYFENINEAEENGFTMDKCGR